MSPQVATFGVLIGVLTARVLFSLSALVCSDYPRTVEWRREDDATRVVMEVLAIIWMATLIWGAP